MSQENRAIHSAGPTRLSHTATASPLLIGDSLHVLDPLVYKALLQKDRATLATLVREQLAAGAQALAVNLGPGKEMGRMTPWVVDIIRDQTGVQLFFSSGILEQRKVLQNHRDSVAINAVTANHNDLVRALAAAKEYGNCLVVLLVQSGKTTAGLDGRIQLASEVLEQAVLIGFPLSRLYLDPVLACRPDPAAWHVSRGLPDIGSAVETIALIRQLDRRVKTIVALGNGSGGMAREQRSGSRCRMLSLLAGAGVDGILLNCLDTGVIDSAEAVRSGWGMYRGAEQVVEQLSPAT